MHHTVLIYVNLLTLFTVKVSSDYQLEVALIQWVNPLRIDYANYCCDSTRYSQPNCPASYGCDTRFHICPQPFTSSFADNTCPYGRYSTKPDSSFSDKDNMTFTFGVNIAGNVPNPMSFIIHKPISLSAGLRITVVVDDEDISYPDDLVDIIRFLIRPVNFSTTFQDLPQQQGKVGTLEISYRITCRNGYYGDTCNQYNCSQNGNGVWNMSTTISSNGTCRTNMYVNYGATANSTEYRSILSLLVMIFFMCTVLVVAIVIVSALMHKTVRRIQAAIQKTVTESQLYYTTAIPPLTPVTGGPATLSKDNKDNSDVPIRRRSVPPPPPPLSLARLNTYKDITVPFQMTPLPPPLSTDEVINQDNGNTLHHQEEQGPTVDTTRQEGLYSSLGSIPDELNPAYSSSTSHEYI